MGFRHKFAYSFFNFSAYKEFLVQGIGKSILYIFIVTLIFSTLANINTINIFRTEITIIESTFEKNAPNFELKDGLLNIDAKEPIYYNRLGGIFIVDTSGKTSPAILESYSSGVFLDSNNISIKKDSSKIQTLSYSDIGDLYVTKDIMKDSFTVIKLVFPLILFTLNPLISLFYNLLTIFLVLGPLSLIICTFIGIKLSYKNVCTISCYAMTMPLMLQSLLDISGLITPEFQSIFYLIALLYCYLAIAEMKKTNKSNINLLQ